MIGPRPFAPVVAAPCRICPFRQDVPIFLRRGRRAEIALALLSGQNFTCHEHVDYNVEEDEEPVPDGTMCAGAAKALLASGATNNLMRVMGRLGAFDPDVAAARGAACWDLTTWQRLPEGATAVNPKGNEEARSWSNE